MDNERNQRRFESVFSKKVRAGKRRTYFFDVRRTKGDDYYLTLTESTRRFNGDGYERHKIFLYKEDFNRFMTTLDEVVSHVKEELMPDYDYDEYTRRHEEYEARKAAGEFDNPEGSFNKEGDAPQGTAVTEETTVTETTVEEVADTPAPTPKDPELESEDDISW